MATFDFGKNIANAYFNAQRIRQAKEQFQQKLTDQRNQWMAQNAIARDRLAAIRAQNKQAQANADRLFKQHLLEYNNAQKAKLISKEALGNLASIYGFNPDIWHEGMTNAEAQSIVNGVKFNATSKSQKIANATNLAQLDIVKAKLKHLQDVINANNTAKTIANTITPQKRNVTAIDFIAPQIAASSATNLLPNWLGNILYGLKAKNDIQERNDWKYAANVGSMASSLYDAYVQNNALANNPIWQNKVNSLNFNAIKPELLNRNRARRLPDNYINAINSIKNMRMQRLLGGE